MNQLSSQSTNILLSRAAGVLLDRIVPHIDHAVEASQQPFDNPAMLRPNQYSKRYGWMHYGIFFPTLPEPHRYANVMTLLGATGTTMFDNDYLVTTTPRDTATLLTSTAADDACLYRSYSMANDCDIHADGSRIAFGDQLVISGHYPNFEVRVAYGDVRLEASIECTDTVSWFVRNIAYEHLSLLARCEGRITQGDDTRAIGPTMCTFEYARSVTPQVLSKQPLPAAWKLPADFFTYQIINLTDDTQLLLTNVRAQGYAAFKGLHIRSLAGRAEVYVDHVDFQVLESTTEVDPHGRSMPLPARFRWQVKEAGNTLLAIDCTSACDWRYGHGRGYAGYFDFSGEVEGDNVSGQGYIEYIDCEAD